MYSGDKARIEGATLLTREHLEHLESLPRDTRLIFVCNPNNPTGTWVRNAEFVAFMEKDDHDRWRYLMLGFGDHMANVSARTTARSSAPSRRIAAVKTGAPFDPAISSAQPTMSRSTRLSISEGASLTRAPRPSGAAFRR